MSKLLFPYPFAWAPPLHCIPTSPTEGDNSLSTEGITVWVDGGLREEASGFEVLLLLVLLVLVLVLVLAVPFTWLLFDFDLETLFPGTTRPFSCRLLCWFFLDEADGRGMDEGSGTPSQVQVSLAGGSQGLD